MAVARTTLRSTLAVPYRPKTQSWVGLREYGGHRPAERARPAQRGGHGGQRATVLHLVQMRAVEAGAGGELGVGPAALRQQAYECVPDQRRHEGGSSSCQIDSTGTSSAAATRCATASRGLWC